MASNLAYGPQIVTDGLVFCVDANNAKSYPGSGTTWYDLSKNISLTLTTVTSASANGIVFDGTDDKIAFQSWPDDLNIDDSTTPRTWEAWCKPDVVDSAYHGIFGHKSGSGCSYWCNGGLIMNSNQFGFNWYDNSDYQNLMSGSPNASAGSAAHIVATFSGGFIRLYVNGELRNSLSSATNLNYGSGMNGVEAGYNSKSGGQHWFDGTIYCLRFYKGKALSHAEIKQNYNTFKVRFGL